MLAIEIAFDFRTKFGKDAIIDLVCFRKLGHNEQDEPLVTQPLMYKKIAQHPGTRKLYALRLAEEGVIAETEAEDMIKSIRAALEAGQSTNSAILYNHKPPFAIDWGPYQKIDWRHPAKTAVMRKELEALAVRLTTLPENFKLQKKDKKMMAARREMVWVNSCSIGAWRKISPMRPC